MEKGVRIEFDTEEPALLWLRGGGVSARQERVSVFTFIRRPIHRAGAAEEGPQLPSMGKVPTEEPPFYGKIDHPIANGMFVESSFTCRVGEVVILEGGERLRTRNHGDVQHRDLCMLTNLHRTIPQEPQASTVART